MSDAKIKDVNLASGKGIDHKHASPGR